MSRQPSARGSVRFGVFELDVSAGELRKQGRKVNLQQQPFQVLALLVRRPGEVVTREELQQALWPGDTFVEFDQGLNTAIKKIRQVLGDSAENPRFVETLPRKGYRFIAPVSAAEEGVEHTASAPLFRGRRLLPVAAVLALALVAGAAAWLHHQPGESAERTFIPIPLTAEPGAESQPSFSPDGTLVAFDWLRPDGGFEVRVKRLDGGESVHLAAGCCPTWSPDGDSIAFFDAPGPVWVVKPDSMRTLYRISPLGGLPRKLVDLHPQYFPNVAWFPGGKWMVVSDRDTPDEPAALFALSLESGEKRRLSSPPDGFEDMHAAVSPDGQALVFGRGFASGQVSALYLLELTEKFKPKGEPKRLTPANTFSNEAAWTPDGRAIIFSSGEKYTASLYEMPFSRPGWTPGTMRRLAFAGEGARMPAISRQGRLAYSTLHCGVDILRLELSRAGRAAAAPEPLISSTRRDHVPQYSPDGKRIAFASNRSGSNEIWVCNRDGSGAVRMTSMGGALYTADPRWSTDGRLIVFGSNPEGRRDTFVIDANVSDAIGEKPKRIPSHLDLPLGSRVGEWTYFTSEGQVWKRPWPPLEQDEAAERTHKDWYPAQVSPDGRFLYYTKGEEDVTSLWRVPIEGGEEQQVLESVWSMNVAFSDEGIYFIPDWPRDEKPSIQFLSFASGKVNRVVTLDLFPAYGFSLSPDGRSLLFTEYQPWRGDLWMVDGFR